MSGLRDKQTVRVPLGIIGLGWALISGCTSDNSATIVFPGAIPPPTVSNFSLPNTISPGQTITVAQSVVVPAGLPFGDTAFSLSYDPPVGETITTVFSAEQVNCDPGETTCSSTFSPQVPFDLPAVGVNYLITFSVVDQLGLADRLTQTVFVAN